MFKRTIALCCLAALLCAAAFAAVPGNVSAAQAGVSADRPFTPIDYNGVLSTVSQHKGQVVVLVFWATWCPPCVMEVPNLMKLRSDVPASKMYLMAVSLDQDTSALAAFTAQRKLNYAVYHGSQDVITGFRVSGIPRVVVYDKTGRQVMDHEGYVEPEVLRKVVDDAMAGGTK
ncbi:thioredoxin-related domain protein [Desulfovibrio sp. X2]|uniref:TlpA family protein disulfide reductase n=1 Tax=Desulfovibrio sp. X2 TaxID=941449 RepID=UPI000358BCAA|nr:TlpA disulfide reductase family protein [Desulfovibrio sp. X2]EPR37571.1 thioredoxin-related domain protein [Desulfovibrio sp. X2]